MTIMILLKFGILRGLHSLVGKAQHFEMWPSWSKAPDLGSGKYRVFESHHLDDWKLMLGAWVRVSLESHMRSRVEVNS